MRNVLKLVLITILFCSCGKKATTNDVKEWNDNLSVEQNIVQNAVYPAGNDFSFFDEVLKNKSVVILGEASHSDLTTTAQKVKMVKYLQTLGFNAIAFEGASFLTPYVYNNPELRPILELEQPTIMSGVWYMQTEFAPMFDIIDRGLKLVGMDDNIMLPQDFIAAEFLLNKYDSSNSINWDSLQSFYNRMYSALGGNKSDSLSRTEKYEVIQIVDDIYNNLERIKSQTNNKDNIDLDALQQWLVNVRRNFFLVSTDIYENTAFSSNETMLSYNARDKQMADNVLWYLEHYPNDKIIIWCHNFHAAKAISQVNRDDILDYLYIDMLGNNLYDKLGDKLYSLSFTSLNSNEINFSPGEFEKSFPDSASYAFIDFQKLRFEDKYDEAKFETAMLAKQRGRWLNVYDGVYFIKQQNNSITMENTSRIE